MAEELFISNRYHEFAEQPVSTSSQSKDETKYQSYSYYRSHFFSVNSATCPLVQAAMPLLIILLRLPEETAILELSVLQEKLLHEINAFSSQVQTYAYPFETLVLSRYILAVSFDHCMLALTQENNAAAWQKFLLITLLQHDHFSAAPYDSNFSHIENIAKITEKLLENPNEHDDILELIFLCLNFSFKKDIVLATQPTKEIEIPCTVQTLIKKIYTTLEKKRSQLPSLLNQVTISPITFITKQKKNTVPLSLIITLIATSIVLISCYLLLNHIFHLVLQPLIHQLNSLS